MKKVQVLVAAMNQHDYSLLDKMNIQSDVIVANQSDFNRVDVFDYKGNQAIYLNFEERGVGLNRNNALMRATGSPSFTTAILSEQTRPISRLPGSTMRIPIM